MGIADTEKPVGPCDYRLSDTEVGATLVEALDDSDLEVRSFAASRLARDFEDTVVRFEAERIIRHVGEHSNTDAILLLGRTGSERASNLLLKDPQYARASRRETELALAKLGDEQLEDKFVSAFKEARGSAQKVQAARDLGYIGTRRACIALAEQLRSPEMAGPRGEYSLRVAVIEALSQALPGEKVLWRPTTPPTDDRYYERIETWATNVLGVSWNTPRPPFFYRMAMPGKPLSAQPR